MPWPPPPYVADASPEAKAAHFAAKKEAVATQARAAVSSFADADEETQSATVNDVSTTYTTLDADVENSVSLGSLFDAQLGRSNGVKRLRRRRLQDAAQPNIDVSACIGGAPSLEDLKWTDNGAAFFMFTIMTTIGYGKHSKKYRIGCSDMSAFPTDCHRLC